MYNKIRHLDNTLYFLKFRKNYLICLYKIKQRDLESALKFI